MTEPPAKKPRVVSDPCRSSWQPPPPSQAAYIKIVPQPQGTSPLSEAAAQACENLAGTGSMLEQLRAQQRALQALYSAYKVEQYAVFEELHELHEGFKATGQPALKPGASVPSTSAPGASQGKAGSKQLQQQHTSAGGKELPLRQRLKAAGASRPKKPDPSSKTETDQLKQEGHPDAAAGAGKHKSKQPVSAAAADGNAAAGPGPGSRYGDDICGYGSDAEPATLTDAEDELLKSEPQRPSSKAGSKEQGGKDSGKTGPSGQPAGAPPPPLPPPSQVAGLRTTRFVSEAGSIAALETIASACSAAALDAEGALAALCSRSGRYLLRSTVVSVGRSTDSKGDVDVDLAKEDTDLAAQTCRRQAFVKLQPDGSWALTNVGRRDMHVNGRVVRQFGSAPLSHLALVEIGGISLLFMNNPTAVARVMRRTGALVL